MVPCFCKIHAKLSNNICSVCWWCCTTVSNPAVCVQCVIYIVYMCHYLQWYRCPHGGVVAQIVPAWASWACGPLDSVPGLPGLHQLAGLQCHTGAFYFNERKTCVFVHEEERVCALISRSGLGKVGATNCNPPQNQLQPSQLHLPVSRRWNAKYHGTFLRVPDLRLLMMLISVW